MWQLPIFFLVSYRKYERERLDDAFAIVKAKYKVKIFKGIDVTQDSPVNFKNNIGKFKKKKLSQLLIDFSDLSQKHLTYISHNLSSYKLPYIKVF